jgi:hypothetical protein
MPIADLPKLGCCTGGHPSTFERISVSLEGIIAQGQTRADAANGRAWLNAVDFDSITYPANTSCAKYEWDADTDTAELIGYDGSSDQWHRGFSLIGSSEAFWLMMRTRTDFSTYTVPLCDYVYIWDQAPLDFKTFESCSQREVTGLIIVDAPELPSTGTERVRYDEPRWSGKAPGFTAVYAECGDCTFDP